MSTATKKQKHAEYLRNRDKYLARARLWAKNNPEKRREVSKRDNAKRSTLKKVWHQLKRYGNVIEMNDCVLCDTEKQLVVHHRDGNNGKLGRVLNNDRDNLVVLCKSCHPKVHYRGEVRVLV